MKVQKLVEQKLVEREIKGTAFNDIALSQEVKDLIAGGKWQDAYTKASMDTTGQKLFVLYVDYQPSEDDVNGTSREMKNLGGYLKPAKGYLQETDAVVKAGGFLKLRNLKNFGSKLFDVYAIKDGKATDEVVRPGYFKCVENESDATTYTEKDADDLVSKIQGLGSDIKSITKRQVQATDVGKAGSEKDIVIDQFLQSVFGDNFRKIEKYKDLVAKAAKEVGLSLEQNVLLAFLNSYLKKHDLDRNGFIVMNNLYANSVVDSDDFRELPILSNSDIYTKSYQDAENIVKIYQSCANGYRWNAEGVKDLYKERTGQKNARSQYTNGNIANLVCYADVDNKCNPTSNKLLPIDTIRANYRKATTTAVNGMGDVAVSKEGEKKKGEAPAKQQGIRISGVPDTISKKDEAKWGSVLSGVTKDDVPSMMAYLKKNGVI